MLPDFNYPQTVGSFGNPLASCYLTPLTQHFDDLVRAYPSVSALVNAGVIKFFDRSISFTVLPGQTLIQATNLSSGYDALLFQRTASIAPAVLPIAGLGNQVLPNTRADNVTVTIERQMGSIDTEQSPINVELGYGWDVNERPTPEFISGSDVRKITIVNNGADTVTVTLTFTMLLL